MPQPYNRECRWGPETLLERPEIAVRMATVSATWAMVEQDIQLLYAFLMSKWTELKPSAGFMPTHPVANLTFTTLQTLNTKLDLLRSLGDWTLTAEEQGELRDTLIPRIRQRAKDRNTVAHGIWAIHDSVPERVILVPHYGDYSMAYSAADFDEMRERMQALRSDINKLRNVISERVEKYGWRAPEPHEQQNEPPPAEGHE